MDATRIGRRAVVAWVGAALAGAGPLVRLARAETTKEAVLKGCRDSGNSGIDNPDGSYQCNLKDGGEIKCNTKDQCIYVPPRKIAYQPGRVVDVGGLVDLVEDGVLAADPSVPVGSVLNVSELGITLVVTEPPPGRKGRKRRHRR